ncbi:uncharacterized protein LJ264_013236 [Porphyrio hochstetteri]
MKYCTYHWPLSLESWWQLWFLQSSTYGEERPRDPGTICKSKFPPRQRLRNRRTTRVRLPTPLWSSRRLGHRWLCEDEAPSGMKTLTLPEQHMERPAKARAP